MINYHLSVTFPRPSSFLGLSSFLTRFFYKFLTLIPESFPESFGLARTPVDIYKYRHLRACRCLKIEETERQEVSLIKLSRGEFGDLELFRRPSVY